MDKSDQKVGRWLYIGSIVVFVYFLLFHTWLSGVYVCSSPGAYSYHFFEDCEALQRCSGHVKKTMRLRAWMSGRDLCEYCKEERDALSGDLHDSGI